jgi:hypothetical protein
MPLNAPEHNSAADFRPRVVLLYDTVKLNVLLLRSIMQVRVVAWRMAFLPKTVNTGRLKGERYFGAALVVLKIARGGLGK